MVIVKTSISDISEATLKIMIMRIVVQIITLPDIHPIINMIRRRSDSLIHRFGLSKLCA